MINMLRKGFALGLGLAVTSKEHAEKVVNELVQKGEISHQESKEFVDQLLKKGEETQKDLDKIINQKIKELLEEINLPSKDDIRRLEERIDQLENRKNKPE